MVETPPRPRDSAKDPPAAAEEDRIVDVDELVQDVLGGKVSPYTVERWYRHRGLPYFRSSGGKGGKVLFRLSAFWKWFAENEVVELDDEGEG